MSEIRFIPHNNKFVDVSEMQIKQEVLWFRFFEISNLKSIVRNQRF